MKKLRYLLYPLFYLGLFIFSILKVIYALSLLAYDRIRIPSKNTQEFLFAKIKFKHRVGSVVYFFKS